MRIEVQVLNGNVDVYVNDVLQGSMSQSETKPFDKKIMALHKAIEILFKKEIENGNVDHRTRERN